MRRPGIIAAIIIIAPLFVPAASRADAQTNPIAPIGSAAALKQIPLTAHQVENFIAARREMDAIVNQANGLFGPNPVALEAAAARHHFVNYTEYVYVANNIALVMDGVDPKTKKYVGAEPVLLAKIEEVEADKALSHDAKMRSLKRLNGLLNAIGTIEVFPDNIELVMKYYDALNAVAPASG